MEQEAQRLDLPFPQHYLDRHPHTADSVNNSLTYRAYTGRKASVMNKICAYETTGTRAYKAITDRHSVLVIRDGNEFECYLKKRDAEGSTPYMFMYGVPINQNPAREVLDIAVANADDYNFLFEDKHWMTPCSIPVFHPSCLLYECSDCGAVIDAGSKFCPECGHKLAWESERIE